MSARTASPQENAIQQAALWLAEGEVVPWYAARDAVEYGVRFVNAPEGERDRLWEAMHGPDGWGPWWEKHLDEDYHR